MPATVTRWWWIRHAPATGHGGRIYGQEDYPADLSDSESFAALAALLPAEPVWVTSHLRRSHETAAAIAAAHARRAGHDARLPGWVVETDIAEQHVGAWHGLTHDELNALRGSGQDALALWPASERPPAGESFQDVIARVGPAVARLTAEHRGRDIVAVAHAGSIRAALAIALGIEAECVLSFAIDNCSLTRLDHIHDPNSGNAWRIVAVNLPPRPSSSR
jgi:broad specificity phosphatase PhoE